MQQTESTLCLSAFELGAIVLWLGLITGLLFHLFLSEQLRQARMPENEERDAREAPESPQAQRRPRKRQCQDY